MAYNQAPTQDTASSAALDLFKEYLVRPSVVNGKDIDFVNVFIEATKHELEEDIDKQIVKRDGTTSLIASQTASQVRGMYYWADQQKLIYAAGTNVYVHSFVSSTTTALSSFFGTSSGDVGFCEFLYDDTSVVIIATDGTTLKSIDITNTIVTCADGDLPTHQPYPIFLNGYLFVVKASSADIYNSNLNDPMSWTPGDFLSGEMEGDLVKRPAKLNNYIILFGTNTIEYFWDVGNASGSPLQRNDTPVKINGYLGGFAQIGNVIYYVGNAVQSRPSVFRLEDFKIQEVGTPTISRHLTKTAETFASLKGGMVSFQGHSFYVLDGGSYTYIMDIDKTSWTRIAYQSSANFPIVATANGKPEDGNVYPIFALAGSTSTIYKFDPTLYQDSGTNFTCTIITDTHSFGTINRKTMHRLSLYTDTPASTSSVSVYWTDDDYLTWSSAVTIDLAQDLAACYRLGWFRQRAFKFTYSDNFPFRLQKVEVDINKGNN